MNKNTVYVVWSEGDCYGFGGDVYAVFDSTEEASRYIANDSDRKNCHIDRFIVNEKIVKNTEYYMDLNYVYEVKKISEEDGGGYLIKVPLLKGCMSDGDTIEDAMKNIKDAQESWIDFAIERGTFIPEPTED